MTHGSNDRRVELIDIAKLTPYGKNARTHSKEQIKEIGKSITRFGFQNPVLVDEKLRILAGHGRVAAAKQLGLSEVPCLQVGQLTEPEKRAYMLADNKLALKAGWDKAILAEEIEFLISEDFEVELTGFSSGEIDTLLEEAEAADPEGSDPADDALPELGPPVTRRGEIWELGRHRLICGDARDPEAYAQLMGPQRADMIFTDPPYNVAIDGHVCGAGAVHHAEFAMASGEMSVETFTGFLTETLSEAALMARDGAIAYVCMDWRHMQEVLTAGAKAFSSLRNLCVWNKTNGGQGSFYRSKHELVFVYRVGEAAHLNTFGLGAGGRYRTNVWDYAGVNTLKAGRMEELIMHPTVKPVALIADAIRDVTRRGDLVLDAFGGSGSTLIAAEKTGRAARLIEYEPGYCDVIVRRWEAYTGRKAILAGANGTTFEAVAEERTTNAVDTNAAAA